MTGIEFALSQLAMKVAKNGFSKIYKATKLGSAAKKTIDAVNDLDLFDIGDGIKNLVKERSEQTRIEKLNKESYDLGEAFLKKSAVVNSPAPSLMVANPKPVYKKKPWKKGKK